MNVLLLKCTASTCAAVVLCSMRDCEEVQI